MVLFFFFFVSSIEDPLQRNATIGFINNFGQIPKQLFKKPHPAKRVKGGASGSGVGSGAGAGNGIENAPGVHMNSKVLGTNMTAIKCVSSATNEKKLETY